MSGTFPATPVPRTVDVESDQPVFVGRSNSGRRHARKIGAHLWRINLKFAPMFQPTFSKIWGFQMKNDLSEVFFYQYPLDNQGVGLDTETTVRVNQVGGVPAGATSVPLDGLAPSVVDKFVIGDFFTFASSAKMHQVVDNANTDATGATVLTFRPETVDDLPDNDLLTVNQPLFQVAFENPLQRYKTSNPEIYRYEADLIEAIL